MLEHVALGQSRFMTPGVSPDPRGVALGRFGLLVFASVEGVVSWFRVYSAESSLDELMAGLEIQRLVTPLGSRSLGIRVPAISSYVLDRAARCARLVGGATYTGSGKHFVKYRDDASPFGYDASEILPVPAESAFMCYGDGFTQAFAKDGELSFTTLLFRLSLRKIPGGRSLRDGDRDQLLVGVAPGLSEGVMRYLWRNQVDAEAALVRPRGDADFSDAPKAFLLLGVRDLPARMLDLFLATPGIDVFRRISGNIAVEVGYDHVIGLAACASLFPEDSVYLFRGREDRVDVVDGPLEATPIASLTRVELGYEELTAGVPLLAEQSPIAGMALKLSPTQSSPRNVVASLVPTDRASWVKKLVFMMPYSTLRGHRVAATDRGVLLVADPGTEVLPVGELLTALSPGLFVPAGFDVVPRVTPSVLSTALNHGPGLITIFTQEGQPFQIKESDLLPLERLSVASIDVDSVTAERGVDSPREPMIVNDPVGRFALWGFPELVEKQ